MANSTVFRCTVDPNDFLRVECEDGGALSVQSDTLVEGGTVILGTRRSIQELRDYLSAHLAATTCTTCNATGRVDDLVDGSTPCPDCLPEPQDELLKALEMMVLFRAPKRSNAAALHNAYRVIAAHKEPKA